MGGLQLLWTGQGKRARRRKALEDFPPVHTASCPAAFPGQSIHSMCYAAVPLFPMGYQFLLHHHKGPRVPGNQAWAVLCFHVSPSVFHADQSYPTPPQSYWRASLQVLSQPHCWEVTGFQGKRPRYVWLLCPPATMLILILDPILGKMSPAATWETSTQQGEGLL